MEELRQQITELVGTASVCWDKNGVFDTAQALKVADKILSLAQAYANKQRIAELERIRLFKLTDEDIVKRLVELTGEDK